MFNTAFRYLAVIACFQFIHSASALTIAQDEIERGENLIKNASFETLENDVPVNWGKSTWSGEPVFSVENEFGRTGERCVKISSESGADASWSYQLSVERNTDYELSAWVKTNNIAAGGFGVQVGIHQLQMEGKSEPIRGTKDWTRISKQFNSGGNTQLLVNMLYGGWGRATGEAWFDDVELVKLTKKVEIPKMSEQESLAFFESKVLPILKNNCFECHGSGEKIRAGLVMTNRADLLKGGDSGPAIDSDSPLESLLLEAINYESYEMPPSGKLAQEDIDHITTWVKLGAPWKGEGVKPEAKVKSHAVPTVNEKTKQWWSYQPLANPVAPDVEKDERYVRNEIDHFIISRLKEKSLSPNPTADRRTLIRRAYYDLIGLPPSTEQMQTHLSDVDPNWYENMIDQLLESPHYGEKWARHWLDVVRYAESNSYERDGTKPFVWRYRDYVIRSFNEDKPYDQFIIEQLAGDELENQTAESLIATGYYRLGKWDDEPVDHEQAWYDDMDDVLATTSQAFLGMTINCARCHDHKIDPIPQADYYKMLAFFRNVQRYGIRAHETVLNQSARPITSPESQKKYREASFQYRRDVRSNRRALDRIEKWVKEDFIPVEHEDFQHEMNRVPLVKKRIGKTIAGREFTTDDADRYETLHTEMLRLRQSRPEPLQLALCVTEKGDVAPETYIMIRGNAHARGDLVQPGFPSVLSPPEPEIKLPSDGQSTGRRLALARWIANEKNPLTARVMVNRIWQHHFGRGIVRSSNDFGFQGNQPTHPELLDWLAQEFIDCGWKIKPIHKLIMTSKAYQMSSLLNDESYSVDPTNNLFWRNEMRRLTAEEIRDSILAVNGTLNKEKMFGPSIFPKIAPEVLHGQSRPGENWGNSSPEDITRRSIYIHIKRSLPVPFMANFDVNDPDTTCPARFNTVQPTQALSMINSDFVNEQAHEFARYIRQNAGEKLEDQISFGLQQVMQRPPSESEIARGVNFVGSLREQGIDEGKSLDLFCVVAYNLNEFLFLD